MSTRTRALPSIERSDALYARAERLIPAGTQTLAKGPSQHVRGVMPKYLVRGDGCRVVCADGQSFTDYTMGVGPLVLGYRHPEVDEAIVAQLRDGIVFSLMHPLEVEVAEAIHAVVPRAERIRFSKTGADVTSAAVRLSRAFTGRDLVLTCGYHGWHDFYVSVTDRHRGVPSAVRDLSYTIPYNDIEAVLASIDERVACVIMEPMTFELPRPGFLEAVRAACDASGTLLVFDEMWTGFRMALGGAQERFRVTADLACFSKAVANGMPLSVLTGRADVMDLLEKDVFFFTTFGGEALSLAAAAATLAILERDDVPSKLDSLGRHLMVGFEAIRKRHGVTFVRCIGAPCRTMLVFDAEVCDPLLGKSFVQQELIRRGILFGGFHNLSAAHTQSDVVTLLAAYDEVVPALANACASGTLRASILGEPVEPVFRRTSKLDTRPRTHPGVSA